MKRAILIILALSLTWVSIFCQKKDVFPNEIKVEKTDKHQRIKGSNTYLIIPIEYEYIESLSRFQKSEKLYLQIVNIPASYEEAKKGFSRKSIESKGAKVDLIKDIKINGKEGRYCEGPSKFFGETKIILVFGNESNVVILVGVHKNEDHLGKEELQQMMKSVYFDFEKKYDPLELANFEFNKEITSFKLNTSISNMYVFSPNGDEEIDDLDVPNITISSIPKMSEEKIREWAKNMIWRMESIGESKLKNKEILSIEINEKKAFVLETEIEKEGKNGWINQTIIIEENSCLIFIASTFSEIEDYKTKFRETVKTLKEK